MFVVGLVWAVAAALLANAADVAHELAKRDLDPIMDLDTPGIAKYYGYPIETHKVQTDDGYMIDVHRIPRGREASSSRPNPVPMLLMHGLEVASDSWLLNGPNGSAGFFFADNGFDVWLGNVRGNKYGRKHISMDVYNKKFWDFSFDEMADLDLPAITEYVQLTTKRQQVYYVGYSQGNLLMFAKLAKDPKFAERIRRFFAVAPVSRVANLKGPMASVGRFHNAFPYIWQMSLPGEYLNGPLILKPLAALFCRSPTMRLMCMQHITDWTGPHWHLNETKAGLYTAHSNAGTSMMNMLHYYQSLEADQFQMYDHGKQRNLKKYGQAVPPLYDLTAITAPPIHIFASREDWLAAPEDVYDYLLKKLPSDAVAAVKTLQNYGHIDFIWGENAIQDIYTPIAEAIRDLDGVKLGT